MTRVYRRIAFGARSDQDGVTYPSREITPGRTGRSSAPTATSRPAGASSRPRSSSSRITVYRHFPDARTLLEACARHSRAANPPPDVEAWRGIADPDERAEAALSELYRHFRRTEAGWSNILRDAELVPLVKELAEERCVAYLRRARDVLLVGRPERGAQRKQVRAALGLAVDFRTWQTLARRQQLNDREAARLMLHLVRTLTA